MGAVIDTCIWIDVEQGRLSPADVQQYTGEEPVIDEETGVLFGRLAARLRKKGRGADFRVQDLWIASQAIQHGFPILTRNAKDFEDIPGITVLAIER